MKILFADDHALFRGALRHVLAKLDDNVEVIEAGSCAEVLALTSEHPDFQLVLLDLRMPDGDGLAVLQTLAQRPVAIPVVVLSGSDKTQDMQRALDAGALGFIPKAVTPDVMLSALRLVLAGGIYVPPEMVRNSAADTQRIGAGTGLTPRQLDVLARVIEGKPNKTIARELHLTEATVKVHLMAVFRTLKVNNRTQVARAVETLKLKLPTT